MDAYEKYVTAVSSQIVPGTEVKVVKEMQAVDTYELVQKAAVEKKYAVIGAILGALGGVVLVMAWEAWKQRLTRK